ncbi:MAG: tetratricopeptide repeat protein [Ferruginibacter sp.]|nr:tetratricopeptide repeat protein [Cytophagales bacterium]
MKKYSLLLVLLGLLPAPTSYAQQGGTLSDQDSAAGNNPRNMLLLNQTVQIEATEAVNNMYNFKFDKAERDFRWIQFQYPEHPLPYFLLGLSEWWKIVPNIEDEQYDERCMAYLDTTIEKAERLYEGDEANVEATFFLAGAYAFKGRLYSERSQWRKATVAGKNALKYLKRGSGSELSPEFLFGDALYNYYVEWVPENYPALKPIFWFLSDGDKALGIKQLQTVANNAFYTRTEAQYFLMRIYSEENQAERGYELAKYMAGTFPDNAYFERYYARTAYTLGQMVETENASLSILAKIDRRMPGYEATSGRYASFYLGYIYQSYYRDPARAKPYFQRAVTFAEQSKSLESGYYLLSLTALARIADQEGDQELAKNYFQKVLDNAEKKSPTHQEAKRYLSDQKSRRK